MLLRPPAARSAQHVRKQCFRVRRRESVVGAKVNTPANKNITSLGYGEETLSFIKAHRQPTFLTRSNLEGFGDPLERTVLESPLTRLLTAMTGGINYRNVWKCLESMRGTRAYRRNFFLLSNVSGPEDRITLVLYIGYKITSR